MDPKIINYIRRNFAIGEHEPTDKQLIRLHNKVQELKCMGMPQEYIEGFINAHFHEITECQHGRILLLKAEDMTTLAQAIERLELLVQQGIIKAQ
jgi:hypothetical protein